jgi:hypothetical protein
MDPLLTSWLSELRESPLVLGAAPGSGGAENLWTLAIPREREDITEDQLLEFFDEALQARHSQATAMGVEPVVFYAWHDEMAGQLRFSVARGTAVDLPFAARVEPVSDLRTIIRSYLGSEYRAGIPWSDLVDVPADQAESAMEEYVVRVWAREIT